MKLILTLGFDEKFALRSIIRSGLSDNDEIYIVLSKGGDPRAEKAFITLNDVILKAFSNVRVEKVYVSTESFERTFSSLRCFLKKLGVDRKVFNLSGGQRVIIVALIAAMISLDLEAEIEIETEDSKAVHKFPLFIIKPTQLDIVDLKILESLLKSEGIRMGSISKETGISRPTVWRRLEQMIKKGIVMKNKKGEYLPTEFGRSRIAGYDGRFKLMK